MTQEGFKRKLTAILSADVIGYSRLMRDDEEATVRDLAAHRVLITEIVQQHNGRVVDSPGDNILAEFASVVDAVNGAIKIQAEIKKSNANIPEDRRMEFRIGINLGDVIEEEERIYGDGVNIAARVEGLAAGGGIAISGTVYEHIKEKLSLGYHYLGEQEVKNISEPVRVYRLLTEPADAGKLIDEKQPQSKKLKRAASAAIALIVLVGGAFAIWNYYFRPSFEPASVEKMAHPLPDKPSIAVLPFDNLSGDPEQDYIADGITGNIISALSKIPDIFVIDRNSTFFYKGKSIKVQKISEELGVRYVLEGSVQRESGKIRITAQLIDAISGYHLWSEQYDRKFEDLFDLLDDITLKIASGLHKKFVWAGAAEISTNTTDSLDAWGYMVKGLSVFYRWQPVDNAGARQLFEKAVEIDPNYAIAWNGLAWTHLMDSRMGWTSSPAESFKKAVDMIKRASSINNELPDLHSIWGQVYLLQRKHDKAIDEGKKAVALDPNNAFFHIMLSEFMYYSGRFEEAISLARQAIRLNPHCQSWYYGYVGRSCRYAGRYQESIKAYKRQLDLAQKEKSSLIVPHTGLASTYASMGRVEQARAHAEKVLEIFPDASLQIIRLVNPFKDPAHLELLINSLRIAGIPEHPPLKLPDKPSIAVLPFDNLSGDLEQEYFADGMTDDLITDLSKISGLFVIARNSTFQYKGKAVDVKKISRELGIRYVLQGSVRKAGDQVRINAQLIDATTGHHLWANRYDGQLIHVFALQDQISQKIVNALKLKLSINEQEQVERKETGSIKAYDAFLQGWNYYYRNTFGDWAKAISHFEKAIELDPEYSRAYAAIALIYWRYTRVSALTMFSDPELGTNSYEARARAGEYLQLAMKEPTSICYQIKASMSLYRRQYAKAAAEAEKALSMDSNNVDGIYTTAYILMAKGDTDSAIDLIKKGMRLDPHNIAQPFYLLGMAYFAKGQLKESVSMIERALTHNPKLPRPAPILPAALAYLGQELKAREALENFKKDQKKVGTYGFNFRSIMFNFPFQDPEVLDRLANGIRKAGMPTLDFKYYKVFQKNMLNEKEIRELFFGQKVTVMWLQDIRLGWIERTEDGKATWINLPGGDGFEFNRNGRSWVDDGMLCDQWQITFGGIKYCMSIFRNPEGTPEMKNEYIAVSDFDFQIISPAD